MQCARAFDNTHRFLLHANMAVGRSELRFVWRCHGYFVAVHVCTAQHGLKKTPTQPLTKQQENVSSVAVTRAPSPPLLGHVGETSNANSARQVSGCVSGADSPRAQMSVGTDHICTYPRHAIAGRELDEKVRIGSPRVMPGRSLHWTLQSQAGRCLTTRFVRRSPIAVRRRQISP